MIQGLEAACYSRLNLQAVLDYLLCCLGCFVGAEGSLQDDNSMVVLKVKPNIDAAIDLVGSLMMLRSNGTKSHRW